MLLFICLSYAEDNDLGVPGFTDATKQLKDFLATQNLSTELLWVFREDIIWRKQLIYVKEPLPLAGVPRLRGKPAGLIGQPFHFWLGGATIALETVSTVFFRFQRSSSDKGKAAEAACTNHRRSELA